MYFDIFNPEYPVNPVKKVFLKDLTCYKKFKVLQTDPQSLRIQPRGFF